MTDPVFALEPDVPRNVRLARWLLFRLLSGLREGSLTVREGAQTFHFGDPAAALRAEARVCTPEVYWRLLTGGSLALVVRSRADRLARSVGPDTLPYPLLCDADGVLYDLLDIPTRSGALSTYSLEAWQIMRDAKRRGYHSPANGQQQLPLTLVLDKDGTVLFSHYGASLTDVPADCGAAQSLLEDLDVAKPVDVDDADVTIYADPGAAPDIPGLTPHVHEYAQPNLGETGVFSVFDDAYKDEE